MPDLELIVHALASALDDAPGDASALRRMDPRSPLAPAFWKLLATVLQDAVPPGSDPARGLDLEERWAAVTVGLAHLGALHRDGARLGEGLARAGWSEHRFVRLLLADREALLDEILLAARFLKARGQSADWTDAARLLLSCGGPHAEQVRREVARAWYAEVSKKPSP